MNTENEIKEQEVEQPKPVELSAVDKISKFIFKDVNSLIKYSGKHNRTIEDKTERLAFAQAKRDRKNALRLALKTNK